METESGGGNSGGNARTKHRLHRLHRYFLLVELSPQQASDIAVQHKLRECLQQHRPDREELGVKVPVIADVCNGKIHRYVRLGSQFCVRDPLSAAESLKSAAFAARCTERLLVA